MATQTVLFPGLVLVLVVHGQGVLADLHVDSSLKSESLLSQSILLQDAAQVQDAYNVSSQCKTEMKRLFNLQSLDTKALMALDAFGKPQAGILQANLAWLGHYDECMSLEGFNYCLVDLAINTTMLIPPKNQSSSTASHSRGTQIRWGVCLPANCSETDIPGVFNGFLDKLKIFDGIINTEAFLVGSASCVKKPPIPYSAGSICTIILCGLIAFLMITGALYDEYLTLQAKKPLRHRLSNVLRSWRLLDEADVAEEDGVCVPLLKDAGTRSPESKHNLAVRLLLCFALNRNLAKLMDVKQGDASIGALNGIRVISLFWVILGHIIVFSFFPGIADNIPTLMNRLQTHWGFQAVANGFFSVDSFFFLSGFLVAYLTFGRFQELRTVKKWVLFYFHRYWRLTPLYAFIILIWMYITPFFGEGPVWQRHSGGQTCSSYWWSNLLYINNFWPTSLLSECLQWGWYLANDMQFFIISPVIMAPMFYYPVFGWVVLCAALLASFTTNGLIIGLNDLNPAFLASVFMQSGGAEDYLDMVYIKPYCRIAPYLVGIGLGYIMHRMGKRKVNMSPVLALIAWLAAAAMAMSLVYGLYPSYHTPMTTAAKIAYGSVSQFAWALAIAWVVFACKYGYGGWINSLLSWSAWVPLARVTYAAYLVHPIVMMVFFNNFATPWHFSVYTLAINYAGVLLVSYFVAVFLSLAVEYPFANLEKLFLHPPRRVEKVDENGVEATETKSLPETMIVTKDTNHEKGMVDSSSEAI